MAKVDATIDKKLAELYDIKGFPTLKIFRNGRRFDYDGPREANGLFIFASTFLYLTIYNFKKLYYYSPNRVTKTFKELSNICLNNQNQL